MVIASPIFGTKYEEPIKPQDKIDDFNLEKDQNNKLSLPDNK